MRSSHQLAYVDIIAGADHQPRHLQLYDRYDRIIPPIQHSDSNALGSILILTPKIPGEHHPNLQRADTRRPETIVELSEIISIHDELISLARPVRHAKIESRLSVQDDRTVLEEPDFWPGKMKNTGSRIIIKLSNRLNSLLSIFYTG